MKNILFTLTLICSSILNLNAQRTYVLVTGVSSYQDSRNNVTQTTKNAKSFARKMQTQTPDVSILTSSYANHDNILNRLRKICKSATASDRIIFYFAGHGSVDNNKTGCICTYDQPLYYSEIMNCFKQSPSKEKFMFIEACHSGSSLRDYIDPNVTCMASSRMDEYSYYSDLVGAGFFSNALLIGLQGKADANGDQKVSISELFKYVYANVVGKSSGKQHPQLITNQRGSNSIIFNCNKLK